jgi:hypothetical protein
MNLIDIPVEAMQPDILERFFADSQRYLASNLAPNLPQ